MEKMYGAAPQIGEIKASATRQTPDGSRRKHSEPDQ
jgi:hypothetical protein